HGAEVGFFQHVVKVWRCRERLGPADTWCGGDSIPASPPAISLKSEIAADHMTEPLAEKTCPPCRGGVPPLARDEALRFQKQAPEWELRDDARRIERT